MVFSEHQTSDPDMDLSLSFTVTMTDHLGAQRAAMDTLEKLRANASRIIDLLAAHAKPPG